MRRIKEVRLGFDLDGVIISKPPLIPKSLVEYLFKGGQKGLSFHFPKTKFEQSIRKLSHFYLLRPPLKINIALIKRIAQKEGIKLYIVSSRYSFLKKETQIWLKKRRIDRLFKEALFNLKDQPPHLFKEKTIKKLGLDCFFEDDFLVADYLKGKLKKTKVYLVSQDGDQTLQDFASR